LNNYFILVPILFPFVCSIIFNIIKFKNKNNRNIFLISVVVLNFIFTTCLLLFFDNPEIDLFKINKLLDIYFRVDRLGILFASIVSFLWICTLFYSIEYMKHEGKEEKFFTFFILTLGVTLGIAFSGNLFTMYVFYEFLTLVTFPLVIHEGSEEALQSGKKYLIYSFFGATLVLSGVILLYILGGNFNFVEHGVWNKVLPHDTELLSFLYLLMFLGFGVKAAIVPLHAWLPSAMIAPTPVSALLHAVAVVKSGIFALIRVTYYIFGTSIIREIHATQLLSILIAITIFMGSMLAFREQNLKKRLAYSTVSQLGYVILGVILLNKPGLTGGLMHLVNHAFIKITLFFCVGAIIYMTGKRNMNEIRGIGKEMPITMWCFSVASISLIGIPPTNGFVSKWYLAQGVLLENRIFFVILLLLSALLTAAYLMPIIITAFFPGKDFEYNQVKNYDPSPYMLYPIVFLTGIVVFLGIFPNIVLKFIKSIVDIII